MIALHQYLLFVGACIVLSAVPGPDMLLVLTRSIAQVCDWPRARLFESSTFGGSTANMGESAKEIEADV